MRSFGLAAVLGMGLVGCGGLDAERWPAGKPRIDRLDFLQQSPGDSLALQFAIEFEDLDADLSGGQVHMLLNGREAAVSALAGVFARQSPPISPEATNGEFIIVVRVTPEVEAGRRFVLSFFLEDGAGDISNEPSVVLETVLAGTGS